MTTIIKAIANNRKISLLLLAVFVASLATILIIYGLLASPIADDWLYYNYYKQGFLSYLEAAMNHTGRLFQWLVVFVGYDLFGMKATKLIPVGLFIALSLSIFWLLRSVKILKGGVLLEGVIAGLLSCLIIFLQPSFFDAYLWLTSSTVYIASIIFLFVNTTFIYILLTKKTGLSMKLLAFLSLVVGQTFSEPTAVFMIGMVALGMGLSALYRKRDYFIKLSLCLGALIGGFLIVYLSPGSVARRTTAPDFDPTWVFVDSLQGFSHMFFETGLWIVGASILFGSILLFVNKRKLTVKHQYVGMSAIIVFLASTYPIFALNNYTQEYVPDRIFVLPVTGTLVAVVLLAIYIALVAPWPKKLDAKTVVAPALAALLIVALPIFMYSGVKNIAKLSLRDKVAKERDYRTSEQIAAGKKTIEIMQAPKLVKGNADDFYYGDGQWDLNGRNWIVNSYLTFHGVDPSTKPRGTVKLIAPPDFYR